MKKLMALLLCLALCASVMCCAAAETVHLEFYNVKPEITEIVDTLIAKFEAENPDIDVEQVQVPDAMTVLQTRIATNSVPDMMVHYASDPRFKEMVNNGLLMDLTDADVFANVKADMLDETKIDGKAFCLPIAMNTAGVFYNKKIFEENGIEIPTTYEEFIAVCEKLKAAGIVPIEMHNMDFNPGLVAQMLELDQIDDYEAVIAQIYSGEKTVQDFPEFRTTAEKLLEICSYAQEDALGTGYDQALSAFANGEAAMLINGIWVIPSLKAANPDVDCSTFALPASAGMKTRLAYQNDLGLAVSESCQNKEAALKFLAFFATEESAQYYANTDGSASYIKNVVSELTESQPLIAYFDSAENVSLWPDQIWQAGVADSFNSVSQQLVADQDIDAYLDNIQSLFVAR